MPYTSPARQLTQRQAQHLFHSHIVAQAVERATDLLGGVAELGQGGPGLRARRAAAATVTRGAAALQGPVGRVQPALELDQEPGRRLAANAGTGAQRVQVV